MTRRQPWPWIVFLVWAVWLYAGMGRLAAPDQLGAFAPDLGIVLFVSLAPRLRPGDLRNLALLLACARAAFSADALLAILAGMLAVAVLTRAVAEFVELSDVLSRALVAGLLAAGLALFLAWVGALRRAPEISGPGLDLPLSAALACGASSALATALAAPLLRRLPGLSAFLRVERRAFA
jgi:hypothetical protein